MIRIDKTSFYDGFNIQMLEKLIAQHEKDLKDYDTLRDYYIGKHVINSRERKDPAAPNNKVTVNYAKYITDMTVGYFLGNPVTYSANYNIDGVTDRYYAQNMARIDTELAKNVSVYGESYELVYANSEAEPRSVCMNPKNTFIVYDDTVEFKKLCAINYFVQKDILTDSKACVVTVYTKEKIITYESQSDKAVNLDFMSETEHYFGDVPVIRYINNDELQGDFEQVISQIDAYNTLQSDRINDKEQFVDAFLLLLGIDIDTDQSKELKREKILCGDPGGEAKYLSKILTEADTEVLRNCIAEDIHKMSFVPDLTDDKFGGNLSGVAIRFKILAFDQMIKNKEQYFEDGLRERFGLYNHFLNVKANVPVVAQTEIDCIFKRNLPVNEYEISQMLVNLKDRVSEETLLGQLSFVTDPHEEAELAKKQRDESNRSLMDLGGYNE